MLAPILKQSLPQLAYVLEQKWVDFAYVLKQNDIFAAVNQIHEVCFSATF
jgi:hypothetical protein